MGPRLKTWLLLSCVLCVVAEDSPPGLVATDNEQDLVAEASQNGAQAQKRDAGLSNSYGEPLPADAYGPPRDIPVVPDEPGSIFGAPPPGAYGPPAPVVFPSQQYAGPPPPLSHSHKQIYGPPKQSYGPPKQIYGPPKPVYGPPKQKYGPPKQSLPKPGYGVPFKPPKFIIPKPTYGAPKPIYGVPKPVYGPPKVTYGTPLINLQPAPLEFQTVNVGAGLGNIETLDLGQNQPAPIYGTPILPNDLQPQFPVPSDSYGPPGLQLGAHEVVEAGVGHYGPPQPDPNPQPPHPGIPAPPTPPHVLYDGWRPIPGVSYPLDHNQHSNNNNNLVSYDLISSDHGSNNLVSQDIHLDLNGDVLPSHDQPPRFSGAQINSGYSSVHQDALADIDLNAIVGGDTNNIDQSNTVFEAHYTEGNQVQNQNLQQQDIQVVELPSGYDRPPESFRQHGAKGLVPPTTVYGAPPNGQYILPPSGQYGVPPGGQYGAPPRPPPSGLPLPYGTYSGGGHSIHTGGRTPSHPVKFREPVPDGLITNIAHTTHHKDSHGIDHFKAGPPYLPPPIRDIKEGNQFSGNHGFNSLSLSIEPSNLYSLPHSGSPINFQQGSAPSGSYGSPVDSYAVPLYIGDHAASDHAVAGSDQNSVATTVDGRLLLANLSNLDAAAILKHCPYHEAILKAATRGERIPQELAASYVASLSSLGSTLSKNQQVLISPNNGFNTPTAGSESVSYGTKDLSTASHSLVQTIVAADEGKKEKYEKSNIVKGKSIKNNGKPHYKHDDKLQFVSNQIQQTSDKIKHLSEETKQLQQKIVSNSQNLRQVNQQIGQPDIPVKGKLGSYSLQIQSADASGKTPPSIPHEQLLSEGLLQSILQAIEQPNQQQQQIQMNAPTSQIKVQNQNIQFSPGSSIDYSNLGFGGLVLPAGYEPFDHTKIKHTNQKAQDQEIQGSISHVQRVPGPHKHRGDIPDVHKECDLRPNNAVSRTVILPSAVDTHTVDSHRPVLEIEDNDVAVYFGNDNSTAENKDEKSEPVTEISVATSISENVEDSKPEFGEKINKKQS